MRAVVQRVRSASVMVDGCEISKIGQGLAILLGVGVNDTEADADWLAEKISNLRIFEDANQKMNLSVKDTSGEALVVSQFTLYGDCRRGRRPSFESAARPEKAKALYEYFVGVLSGCGVPVKTGQFQATMLFSIENDGPVTIIVDTTANTEGFRGR